MAALYGSESRNSRGALLGRSRQRSTLAVAAGFFWVTAPLSAQTEVTLSAGASVIRYEGFLTSNAATLAPAVRFDALDFSIAAQGNWTVFESGNQIYQATAAAAWLTPARANMRLELSAATGASQYADEVTVGHALIRGRLHLAASDGGGWVAASTGASFGDGTATPLELALGGWRVRERLALVGSVTTTWLADYRHLDLAAAARLTHRSIQLEGQLGGRPFVNHSQDFADGANEVWGAVSMLVPLGNRVSLTASGGNYPSDPVRRVLGAAYATAGLQLALAGPSRLPAPAVPAHARRLLRPGETGRTRLEIAPAGEMYALRIHVADAVSVELMADFTDWQPLALIRVAVERWEIRLPVTAGVHRLNVRINDGPWLVPDGARIEVDDFGGMVGLIVID